MAKRTAIILLLLFVGTVSASEKSDSEDTSSEDSDEDSDTDRVKCPCFRTNDHVFLLKLLDTIFFEDGPVPQDVEAFFVERSLTSPGTCGDPREDMPGGRIVEGGPTWAFTPLSLTSESTCYGPNVDPDYRIFPLQTAIYDIPSETVAGEREYRCLFGAANEWANDDPDCVKKVGRSDYSLDRSLNNPLLLPPLTYDEYLACQQELRKSCTKLQKKVNRARKKRDKNNSAAIALGAILAAGVVGGAAYGVRARRRARNTVCEVNAREMTRQSTATSQQSLKRTSTSVEPVAVFGNSGGANVA